MTTKDIRKALKAGKKVTFNRHIYGAPHGFERLPVLAVKAVDGLTYVKFRTAVKGCGIAWELVQPDLDDYVSIDFPLVMSEAAAPNLRDYDARKHFKGFPEEVK